MREQLRSSASSQQGLARANNEDNFALLDRNGGYPCVLIVADGMGGHSRGEIASSIAVEYICSRIDDDIARLSEEAVRSAKGESEMLRRLTDMVEKANIKVYLGSLSEESNHGMGTTLTMVLLTPQRLFMAHVGDSRAYLFRNGRLCRLTNDHTLVQELLQLGQISESESVHHPRRNVLTRSLGMPDYVEPDVLSHEWAPGDRMLVCSDGLHGCLSDNGIAEVLRRDNTPGDCVEHLMQAAVEAGGGDDITVLVAFG